MWSSDNQPTGRENTTVLYCSACGWRTGEGEFVPNACPDCQCAPLSFVRYEKGVEDRLAEAIIVPPERLYRRGETLRAAPDD